MNGAEITGAAGVPFDQVEVSLEALEQAGYVVEVTATLDEIWADGITERARPEVGTRPTPDAVLDRLIAAWDEAEHSAADPARRDKVVATRQALTGFLRDVAVGVIAGQIGTPR